jgi:hypothetical protein
MAELGLFDAQDLGREMPHQRTFRFRHIPLLLFCDGAIGFKYADC